MIICFLIASSWIVWEIFTLTHVYIIVCPVVLLSIQISLFNPGSLAGMFKGSWIPVLHLLNPYYIEVHIGPWDMTGSNGDWCINLYIYIYFFLWGGRTSESQLMYYYLQFAAIIRKCIRNSGQVSRKGCKFYNIMPRLECGPHLLSEPMRYVM